MKKITILLVILFISLFAFSQQYEVTDFNNPSAFDDISTTGTALNLTDDGEENIISSFPITMGSITSTDLRVGNNGAVLFGTTTGDVSPTNSDLLTTLPMIAPFWDDFDDNQGNVYWKENGAYLIIQWNRPHYDNGVDNAVFQIKITPTNDIYFVYNDVDFADATLDGGASATIGISTPEEVFQFSENTALVSAGWVIKFTPSPITTIPDTVFETYLETHNAAGDVVALGAIDSMGNGIIDDHLVYTNNIENVTSLNVSIYSASADKISDLTGIEDFSALEYLSVATNNLTSLDVSNNTSLTYLNTYQNFNLTSLNISGITTLEHLRLGGCNLSSIDVSANPNLEDLDLFSNNLNEININNNTALTFLRCSGNNISSLDVNNNTVLENLYCHNNQISSIDASNNPLLEIFWFYNNNLSDLNIQNGANNLLSGTFDYQGQGQESKFRAEGNPNLHCIYVDNSADATAGINDYQDWSIDTTSNFVANTTECSATYPAPANDECVDAISLDVQYNIADFTSATTTAGTVLGASDSGVAAEQCGGYTGDANDDVWYTFTPNNNNIHITFNESFDGVINLYSGSCGSLSFISCDDFVGEGIEQIDATDLTIGEQYYVRIFNYYTESPSVGDFEVAIWSEDSITSANTSENTIEGLSIYPNPVNNILHISANENITHISIYNMLGQEVKSISPVSLSTTIDFSNLVNGAYFVKTEVGNQIETYKIIKK